MRKKYKYKLSRKEYKKIIDHIIKRIQDGLNDLDKTPAKNEQKDNFRFTKPFMVHMMKKHYREELGMNDVSFVDKLNSLQLQSIFEECMRINFLINTEYMNISIEEGMQVAKESNNQNFKEKIDLLAFEINQANDDATAMSELIIEDEENVI
jgi:hypothetical protein